MKNHELAEKMLILVGADILFNNGALTSRIIICYHDVLKKYYNRKRKEYSLTDMAFGC